MGNDVGQDSNCKKLINAYKDNKKNPFDMYSEQELMTCIKKTQTKKDKCRNKCKLVNMYLDGGGDSPYIGGDSPYIGGDAMGMGGSHPQFKNACWVYDSSNRNKPNDNEYNKLSQCIIDSDCEIHIDEPKPRTKCKSNKTNCIDNNNKQQCNSDTSCIWNEKNPDTGIDTPYCSKKLCYDHKQETCNSDTSCIWNAGICNDKLTPGSECPIITNKVSCNKNPNCLYNATCLPFDLNSTNSGYDPCNNFQMNECDKNSGGKCEFKYGNCQAKNTCKDINLKFYDDTDEKINQCKKDNTCLVDTYKNCIHKDIKTCGYSSCNPKHCITEPVIINNYMNDPKRTEQVYDHIARCKEINS